MGPLCVSDLFSIPSLRPREPVQVQETVLLRLVSQLQALRIQISSSTCYCWCLWLKELKKPCCHFYFYPLRIPEEHLKAIQDYLSTQLSLDSDFVKSGSSSLLTWRNWPLLCKEPLRVIAAQWGGRGPGTSSLGWALHLAQLSLGIIEQSVGLRNLWLLEVLFSWYLNLVVAAFEKKKES